MVLTIVCRDTINCKDTIVLCNGALFVSGQLPRRTIPHRTGFGPDPQWFYSVVVVLVGSCPRTIPVIEKENNREESRQY